MLQDDRLSELSEQFTRVHFLSKQVAQRDRAKLDRFSINVQRYSQNHAQDCILGHSMGASRAI